METWSLGPMGPGKKVPLGNVFVWRSYENIFAVLGQFFMELGILYVKISQILGFTRFRWWWVHYEFFVKNCRVQQCHTKLMLKTCKNAKNELVGQKCNFMHMTLQTWFSCRDIRIFLSMQSMHNGLLILILIVLKNKLNWRWICQLPSAIAFHTP